ncbi:transporter [[Clostridium] spiroforme]|nr:transporter [Thomasclavelia spiroformis]MBM6879846.1 transporter [Thomasclavelia spiroformis]
MEAIFVKAIGFILVIIIGFVLKQIKILDKRDGQTIATIIMNVTLPCALLCNGNGVTINAAMLMVLAIGLSSNIIMLVISYFLSKKEGALNQGYYMLNCSGYNIGNFAMPFVQTFFPGMGVAYLCMFDVGNSIMCLGGTYALAGSVASSGSNLTLKNLLKKLFSSIPFDVYILIFILAVFHVQLPDHIISIASFIGAGNGFLAMFMIGLLLEVKINPMEMKMVVKTLFIRLFFGMILMLAVYFALPLPLLAKKIAVLAMAAPITTVAAVFSRNIGYRKDAPAIASSLSIIISIFVLTVLIMIFA